MPQSARAVCSPAVELHEVTITAAVRAESLDDALRSISAYADPDNEAPDEGDPVIDRVEAIRFEWAER